MQAGLLAGQWEDEFVSGDLKFDPEEGIETSQ
jgi:hypothetical protein